MFSGRNAIDIKSNTVYIGIVYAPLETLGVYGLSMGLGELAAAAGNTYCFFSVGSLFLQTQVIAVQVWMERWPPGHFLASPHKRIEIDVLWSVDIMLGSLSVLKIGSMKVEHVQM